MIAGLGFQDAAAQASAFGALELGVEPEGKPVLEALKFPERLLGFAFLRQLGGKIALNSERIGMLLAAHALGCLKRAS